MNGTSERLVTLSRQAAQAARRPPGRTRCNRQHISQLHDTRLEPPCAAPDRLSSLYVPVFAAQESAPARPKPAVICFPSCDGSPGFLVTSDLDRKSARFRVG